MGHIKSSCATRHQRWPSFSQKPEELMPSSLKGQVYEWNSFPGSKEVQNRWYQARKLLYLKIEYHPHPEYELRTTFIADDPRSVLTTDPSTAAFPTSTIARP